MLQVADIYSDVGGYIMVIEQAGVNGLEMDEGRGFHVYSKTYK